MSYASFLNTIIMNLFIKYLHLYQTRSLASFHGPNPITENYSLEFYVIAIWTNMLLILDSQ